MAGRGATQVPNDALRTLPSEYGAERNRAAALGKGLQAVQEAAILAAWSRVAEDRARAKVAYGA